MPFGLLIFMGSCAREVSCGLSAISRAWREALATDRDTLIAVRNKVAHNRPVTQSDLDALHVGSRRLGLLDEGDCPS
jgi:hypothetical protein